MAWPIGHVPDERGRFAKVLHHTMSHDEIFLLVAPTDVVDRARGTIPQHMLDRRAMIEHRGPVPPVAAVAIERERLAFDGIGDEQRDEFFWVLIGTIGIAAS